jgi:hypothetical protein
MTFELTNIRSEDRRVLSRAESFLLDNPDPGVRLRPGEELQRAMETGQGLVLTQDSEICGLSLIYKFDVPPDGPIYSEIGTMRITANGYSLQVFLAKFHLFQIELEEYEDGELPAVFAVVSPGTASAYNLQDKVGMSDWRPPKELGAVRGAAGVPFSDSKRVLLASHQTFANAIRDLRRWHHEGNLFKTPKGSSLVRVEIGWFSPEALAAKM